MDNNRMASFDWTIALQLITALGSVGALGALLRVRGENLKLKAEAANLEESINDRIFDRMGKLNLALVTRLAALEMRLSEQEAENGQAAEKIAALQGKISDLEIEGKNMKNRLREWQIGIGKLMNQLGEHNITPAWTPSEGDN